MRRAASLLARLPFLVGLLAVASCGHPESPRSFLVETPEGKPLRVTSSFDGPTVLAVARDPGSGRFRRLNMNAAPTGSGLLVDPWGPREEAFLWVTGCRDLPLPLTPSPSPLRLAYGPRVRLRVVSDGELPTAPYALKFVFVPRGPGDAPDATLRLDQAPAASEGWFPVREWDMPSDLSISGTDPVTVRFCRAGPYRAIWTFMHFQKIDGGTIGNGIGAPDAGISFVVQDGVEDQLIDLRISGAALRDARQSLGK